MKFLLKLLLVLGLSFIIAFLLAKAAVAKAPSQSNEGDYYSKDITITDDAIQKPDTVYELQLPVMLPKKAVSRRDSPSGCESYRTVVEEYFGDQTDTALFVSSKEGGCQNIRGHKINPNGTWDYCIFQINDEPSTLDDIDLCVRRAWEKYSGRGNWSAWYAVCTKDRQPKYEGIKCR